jgi:DNA-binding NarL/FixJ family response regulator
VQTSEAPGDAVLKPVDSTVETPWRELLSPREREVVALVAGGASNRTAGFVLGISDKAVEKHLASAFAKLGVASRTQIAARVIAEGAARRAR